MNTEIDSTVKPLRFAFKKTIIINKKRLRKVIIATVRNTDRILRNAINMGRKQLKEEK